MPRALSRLAALVTVASLSLFGTGGRSTAQTYPIDCAILLCLSGGWPISVPCARARAEFIRRITPWPVEPPLQIWNCPMGASYQTDARSREDLLYDILFQGTVRALPLSQSRAPLEDTDMPLPVVLRRKAPGADQAPGDLPLWRVANRADIDISGPEFNFVRSIRVFDVRYAYQRESGRDSECLRGARVILGTYGMQGEFSLQHSSTHALPEAHVGLEGWGDHCPRISHRSVFVDWRDYEGHYGFEQVNY